MFQVFCKSCVYFKQSNFNVVDVAFRGSKVPRPEMVKLPLSTITCGSSRHMVSMSMMRSRGTLMIVTMILMNLTIVTPIFVANTTCH